MRFGWASVAVAATLGMAACGAGDAGVDAEANARAAAFFLESNAKAEGVQTTESGLQYKVVQSGPSGAVSPDRNDLVRVDYEGSLTNGTVFDSSFSRGQPYVTTAEQVVPGWTEALQRMKVGDEWLVYIPPELGYGARSSGQIPPNSVLVFRMELLAMDRVPGVAPPRSAAMG